MRPSFYTCLWSAEKDQIKGCATRGHKNNKRGIEAFGLKPSIYGVSIEVRAAII
jgi:hypothetical protein